MSSAKSLFDETFRPFVTYKPTLKLACEADSHPTDVLESSSLASIELPRLQNTIPKHPLKGLSQVQVEAALLAINKHAQIAQPGTGERYGFCLGDGVGMGKGRIIAYLFIEGIAQKRLKGLWFSVSYDLYYDAVRDFKAVGGEVGKICSYQDLLKKNNGNLKAVHCNVIFIAYSSINSDSGQARIKSLIEWLGGSKFEGLIAMDECHVAKKLSGSTKKVKVELDNVTRDVKSGASNTALRMQELDLSLPQARFLYCSATVAEVPTELEYMRRLFLWGPGTDFNDYDDFRKKLRERGMFGLESLAMELKAEGKYISRRLDFKNAGAKVVYAPLTVAQIELYNKCTKFWDELKKVMEKLPANVAKARRHLEMHYWNMHLRFFRMLCMSLKANKLIAEIRKNLSNGLCVVVGLFTTGESSLNNASKNDRSELFSALTYIASSAISRIEQGSYNDEIIKRVQQLKRYLCSLKLPPNILDTLVCEFGDNTVAELTGRSGRYVKRGQRFVYETKKSTNVEEAKLFNQGEKKLAIVSEASSTGISLHSDKNFKNRRQRVHISIEFPWSAEKTIQQMGRTFRSNQVSPPIYQLMVTDVAGEVRFGYAVLKRLESLGAFAEADRNSSNFYGINAFQIDTKIGKKALKEFLEAVTFTNIIIENLPVEGKVKESENQIKNFSGALKCVGLIKENHNRAEAKEKTSIEQFLNRLLGVQVRTQHEIFKYFMTIYHSTMEKMKLEGKYDPGTYDFTVGNHNVNKWRQFTVGKCELQVYELIIDKGIPFTTIEKLYQGSSDYFYLKKMSAHDSVYLASYEQMVRKYTILEPSGRAVNEVKHPYGLLGSDYKRVGIEQAKPVWEEDYKKGYCHHQRLYGKCSKYDKESWCGFKCRYQKCYLITGCTWSHLAKLEGIFDDLKIAMRYRRLVGGKLPLIGIYVDNSTISGVENGLLRLSKASEKYKNVNMELESDDDYSDDEDDDFSD